MANKYETIIKIIKKLEENPNNQIGLDNIGCGGFCKQLNPNEEYWKPKYYKPLIGGETYQEALQQVYYLFWDLAVTLDLSDDDREVLRRLGK